MPATLSMAVILICCRIGIVITFDRRLVQDSQGSKLILSQQCRLGVTSSVVAFPNGPCKTDPGPTLQYTYLSLNLNTTPKQWNGGPSQLIRLRGTAS
ncbi:unnamed protein product [Lathyrus oleraceus]